MPAAVEEHTEPTTVHVERGEQSAHLLAEEIEKLADAAESLFNESRLKRRTILVLLRDRTGLPMGEIDLVLKSLPELREYLR